MANTKKNTNSKKKNASVGPASKSEVAGLRQRVDNVMRLFPKGSFGNIGTTAGMAFGGPAGAAVGGALGKGLSAITGYGDYAVSSNTLSTMSASVDTVPQFVRNDHSVRVIHREYVQDITVPSSPAVFNNTTFAINPSNGTLFPWLSTMAKQYQQYNIRGMVVEYKSMSSDYAASGPLGTVAIATNYNINDTPFLTKIALENSEFAVSCKPSMSLVHAIECDPEFSGRKFYYVRDPLTEGTSTSDNRLYDVGLLQVATAGLPGSLGATLGELWVSYDIEFTKPVLPGAVTPVVLTNGFALTSHADGTSSKTNGSVGRITYVQAQPGLTANTGTKILAAATATASGDTLMDNNVCRLSSIGGLWLQKDGVYTIVYRALCATTSVQYQYRSLASAPTVPVPFGAGTATYVDNFSYVVADFGSNFTSAGKDMLVCVRMITVSGCGPDGSPNNLVQLDSPTFVTSNSSLAAPTETRVIVTWQQTAASGIQI